MQQFSLRDQKHFGYNHRYLFYVERRSKGPKKGEREGQGKATTHVAVTRAGVYQ